MKKIYITILVLSCLGSCLYAAESEMKQRVFEEMRTMGPQRVTEKLLAGELSPEQKEDLLSRLAPEGRSQAEQERQTRRFLTNQMSKEQQENYLNSFPAESRAWMASLPQLEEKLSNRQISQEEVVEILTPGLLERESSENSVGDCELRGLLQEFRTMLKMHGSVEMSHVMGLILSILTRGPYKMLQQ